MNPPDDLEQRLRALAPAPVPGHLRRRLAGARHQVRVPAKPRHAPDGWLAAWRQWWWAPLSATALVAATLALRNIQPPASAPAAVRVFTAESADEFLLRAEPLELVWTESGQPFQLVRCTWIDRESYRAPVGDDRVQLYQARDEIVPVALRIF
jgi:hypothetical protein